MWRDLGEVAFVPNRHQQANRVDILQMDMWSVDFLRPFKTTDLAKTGDSDKKLLLKNGLYVQKPRTLTMVSLT